MSIDVARAGRVRPACAAGRTALIAIIFSMAGGMLLPPDTALAAESRYSSIANRDCRIAAAQEEVEEVEEQLKTCPGPGGIRVTVLGMGTSVRIGFAWPGTPAVASAPAVVEAWSAGERIEWRGARQGGAFRPHAATIRMLYPRENSPRAGAQVLAVIKVARGEACLMGAVDIGANRDGYELARRIADRAGHFACGRDRPALAGRETEAARRLLEPVAD